jgi:hypothetical protein
MFLPFSNRKSHFLALFGIPSFLIPSLKKVKLAEKNNLIKAKAIQDYLLTGTLYSTTRGWMHRAVFGIQYSVFSIQYSVFGK